MQILFIFSLLSIVALFSYSATRLLQEEPQPIKVREMRRK